MREENSQNERTVQWGSDHAGHIYGGRWGASMGRF
jgi:hypothetical protein